MRNVPVIFSPKPEGFGSPVNAASPRSQLLVEPEAEGSLAAARLSTAEGSGVDLREASRSLKVRAGIEVPGSLGEGTKRKVVSSTPFFQ